MKHFFEKIDKVFLGIVLALTIIGVVMFVSASLGILARSDQKFYGVLTNQLISVALGVGALFVTMSIPYKNWRKYSLFIFLGSLVLTALVFVPGISFAHGGARRWISLGSFQFQPAEFLKIGFIMYFATWLSWFKSNAQDVKKAIMPFVIMIGTMAAILLRQPDTKSIMLMVIAGAAMCVLSGIPWKYILGFLGTAIVLFLILATTVPYLHDRIDTFIHPEKDAQGASWQITQSLNAIGSGQIAGRGLGQSIQKFGALPEPQGDSIFAVLGEEMGFIGTALVVLLYLAFALRGLRIASHAPDHFSKLLVTGLVILLVMQSYLNIAALIGIFPLTGVPLVFMSHGGTSLMTSLAIVGIILNVSKSRKSSS